MYFFGSTASRKHALAKYLGVCKFTRNIHIAEIQHRKWA